MTDIKGKITLFEQRSDCCGCGACVNVCQKNAIVMVPDEFGFMYPTISEDLCVRCGMCKSVCAIQNSEEICLPEAVYAAVSKNERQLLSCASGGIFSTLAEQVIGQGGVVYGCSMEREDGKLTPKHIRVDTIKALEKLKGSKYVQSDCGKCFQKVKDDLIADNTVLFSGTPCQVAALRRYLGKTDKRRLFTVDIICHGVPSARMFQDYIAYIEKKKRKKAAEFYFRDKSAGWKLMGAAVLEDKKGNTKKIKIPVRLSSYYSLFLNSDIYRESCYECKYAGKGRVGDITIGDFWGIEREHPEYLCENGGVLDKNKGISCILVNTGQGSVLLEKFGQNIRKMDSSFEKVASRNKQLNSPSKCGENRDRMLELYSHKGYGAVERQFVRDLGIKKPLYEIWERLPESVKRILKRIKSAT
ncbi:MAG: Coenzyme F420 hydrogenase/dehydrogenase, beta subunit C-terminal domain [Oscillospiraceae bacterium]